MIKNLFVLIFFLFLSHGMVAQYITGKIVDENNDPVPYATIQIGENYGVVSNMEGVFNISVSGRSENTLVTISYMGYESLEIPLEEFHDQTYVLKEKINELDEVLVTNKQLSPEEIVEEMLRLAPDLYVKSSGAQDYFLRNQEQQKLLDFTFEIDKATQASRSDLKELNNNIKELTESLKNKGFQYFTEYYGNYTRLEDSSKVSVEKAVILKDKSKDISSEEITKKLVNTVRTYLEPGETYKVKTGIIKIEDSLSTDEMFEKDLDSLKGKTKYIKGNLLGEIKGHTSFYKSEDLDFIDKMKRYTYNLEGYTNIDGESVYIISFTPNRGSAKFQGKMYINVFDYGLMRLEYEMLAGQKMENVNLKFLLGIKYTEDRVKATSVFKKDANGKYYLKFGRWSSGSYAYVSRPLKFIKNKKDRSDDKQVFKLDFLIELDMISVSEVYFSDRTSIDQQQYKAVPKQEEYSPIEIQHYDPSIWDGYNIIAPIEEIKNYGKETAVK